MRRACLHREGGAKVRCIDTWELNSACSGSKIRVSLSDNQFYKNG